MSGKDAGPDAAAAPAEFLVVFAHHNLYFNMRFQELEALAGLLPGAASGGSSNSRAALYAEEPAPTALSASPLALVRLPGGEEAARRLCERSVLIKAVLEVWATGATYEEAVAGALAAGAPARARRRQFLAPPRSFQIRFMAFGRTATMEDKGRYMELLGPLFEGDEVADLHDPDTTVWALEEHDHHTDQKTHLGPRAGAPRRVVVGRQVAGGRSIDKKLKGGEKAYFQRYDLSQRAVLGPTTLENELAFIMANCARARARQVALEPFCGTGGILLALSHFGAHCVGTEIDIRVLKGWRIAYVKNEGAAREVARARGIAEPERPGAAAAPNGERGEACRGGRLSLGYLADIGIPTAGAPAAGEQPAPPKAAGASGRDIFTNFVQYGLPTPEVVVCDNAMRPWRQPQEGWCDCIVTDPPYGVRAGAKKQGRDPSGKQVEIQDRDTYIPSKVSYGEDEMAKDLLMLAAGALRDGGRLVFLAPVDLADFLGIDRAAAEHGAAAGGPRGTLRQAAMPKSGRNKDPRLCISETSRDPRLLDEERYRDFLPSHAELELVGASLQILSGGLGRLLVTMQRRPRAGRLSVEG